MNDVDAGMAIGDEAGKVAPLDAAGEQFQIAAEVEDTGKARARDHIFDRQQPRVRQPFGLGLPQTYVAQHLEVEVGAIRRSHERPKGVRLRIPANVYLPQIEQDGLVAETGFRNVGGGAIVDMRHMVGRSALYFVAGRCKPSRINHMRPHVSIAP
jgi:hypothetical protein